MIGRNARWRMLTLAEKARRHHEAWLDRAIARAGAYPRIPLRRVDQGGFDHVRTDHTARQWADSWWRDAFTRVDESDQSTPKRKRMTR